MIYKRKKRENPELIETLILVDCCYKKNEHNEIYIPSVHSSIYAR